MVKAIENDSIVIFSYNKAIVMIFVLKFKNSEFFLLLKYQKY